MPRIIQLLPFIILLFNCEPSTSPPATQNLFLGLWKYSKSNNENNTIYSGTIRFSDHEFLASCKYVEYLSLDSTQCLRMNGTYDGTVTYPSHTKEQLFTAPSNPLKLIINNIDSKDTIWFSGNIKNDTLELDCINETVPSGFLFPTSTVYLFR